MNRAMLFSSAMDYSHLTTLIIPNYVKTNNTTVCHECCIASGKICLLNRFTFYTSQRSVGRFSRIRPVFAHPLETPVSHAHCKNRGRSKMRQCAPGGRSVWVSAALWEWRCRTSCVCNGRTSHVLIHDSSAPRGRHTSAQVASNWMLAPGKVAGPSSCLRRAKSETIPGVSATTPCVCQWSIIPSRGGRSYRISSSRERGGSELVKGTDA